MFVLLGIEVLGDVSAIIRKILLPSFHWSRLGAFMKSFGHPKSPESSVQTGFCP